MRRDGQWRVSALRRAIDALIATAAMTMLAPVAAVVALVVLVKLGRPVMFHQERAGLAGSAINVPKFRTMSDDRASDRTLLPDEQRLTPTGRLLRSSSLDELPQLWSVVRGDMSLVGPRPLPMKYVELYSETQRRRLEAKPGITGWAQVQGRNGLSWPEKFALDVWWIGHASPWLDLRILAMTVLSVVRREGVSSAEHATMPEFIGEQ